MYDTFGDTQLKLTEDGENYSIGDKVDSAYADGVYIGYEGVVVIKDGIFIAEFPHLIDKYGGIVETMPIVDERNPVTQMVKDFVKKQESPE